MIIEKLPSNLELPDLLDEGGRLRLLPAVAYDLIPRDNLRVWCHKYARYGLPTIELILWLRERIGNRTAIEIGSGAGDLAWHLGIPATDSRIQEEEPTRSIYLSAGQPVIVYPPSVEKLEAHLAVAKYLPQVVVASWVTQWIDPELAATGGGSMFGVHENLILTTGATYILIGNRRIHGDKKIMSQPHEEFALPFLRSRAKYPEEDRVFIWNSRR
jgi:hypothetical protein